MNTHQIPPQENKHPQIITNQTSTDIKEKIQKASALMMERNYQAYKDLENK